MSVGRICSHPYIDDSYMYIYIFTTSNMMTIADIIEVQQVKILQQTEVDIDLGNHNVNLCR